MSTELEVIRLMFVVEIPITKILGLKTTTTTTTTSHNSNSKEETQIRIQTIREEIRIGIRTLTIREGMLLYQRTVMQTRSQQRHQREGRTPMESECWCVNHVSCVYLWFCIHICQICHSYDLLKKTSLQWTRLKVGPSVQPPTQVNSLVHQNVISIKWGLNSWKS